MPKEERLMSPALPLPRGTGEDPAAGGGDSGGECNPALQVFCSALSPVKSNKRVNHAPPNLIAL